MNHSNYFDLNRCTALSSLRSGASVHIIGVCGVAMAQLAVLLTERGFKVTGSDKEFYEPMASLLSKAKVHTYQGYSANNISSQLDLVIIGNAVSYGHVEVAEVERLQIPYSIFPRILAEMIIADKHSLVVCGTHGKTTTSGMAAFVLRELGADPSYFVGGVCRDLERSMAEGSGSCSVVEGDEYDSSFFAKVPKFKFYRPDSLIITSLEYDHADIYPDIESIEAVFAELVSRMDSESRCAVCIDDANIAKLIPSWRRNSKGGFLTYGSSSAADYILEHTAIEGGMQKVRYTSKMYGGAEFEIPLIGGYNAKNALAVLAVLTGLGFERNKVFAALKRYTGVKRRQELRFNGEVTVIEDFAHHPSAVRETIAAVKQAYPGRRLWSVFEPRSNTSRLKIFEREYLQAFDGAELIILCQVDARPGESAGSLLDVKELAQRLTSKGLKALALPNAQEIKEYLVSNKIRDDLILVMSNGSFGGLIEQLIEELTCHTLT